MKNIKPRKYIILICHNYGRLIKKTIFFIKPVFNRVLNIPQHPRNPNQIA